MYTLYATKSLTASLWRLGADGRFWWTWTAQYAIFAGADAREAVIVSPYTGPPVTRADRASALEGLLRFREVGGHVDPSRIPDRKPAIRTFSLDDEDNVWVMRELAGAETGRRLNWFDNGGA